jgi:mono/diheme cytochrome c family protein
MKYWLGFLTAMAVFTIAAIGLGLSGIYSVAANQPDTDLKGWLLSTMMRRSVVAHADQPDKNFRPTETQVRDGFRLYNETCIYCHGAPGHDPSDIGKGLNPEPPYLPDRAERWTNAELFWIIKNGVKMTGMPSFGVTHKDSEIWNLVAFVQRLPKMTDEQFKQMEQ